MTTRAEQETVVRWDMEEQVAYLQTAHPAQARQWQRLGYPVVSHRDRHGKLSSWEARVPRGAVRFRPLVDGKVKKRSGHYKGKLFEKHDQ